MFKHRPPFIVRVAGLPLKMSLPLSTVVAGSAVTNCSILRPHFRLCNLVLVLFWSVVDTQCHGLPFWMNFHLTPW